MAYWDAFAFLSRFRKYQDGSPSPLSLGDIHTYCDFVGIKDVSQRMATAEMILALDSEWFQLMRERAELDKKNEQRKREREKAKR
ncbi:MAG: hypothetical protein OEM91_05055 [Hyphomicrobiales bacterium]|nr:hypothetical protein [Hyphomicrobiales bacterium]